MNNASSHLTGKPNWPGRTDIRIRPFREDLKGVSFEYLSDVYRTLEATWVLGAQNDLG